MAIFAISKKGAKEKYKKMIPKTVGELIDYLETYDAGLPIFTEDSEGMLWWFTVEYEKADPQFGGPRDFLMISSFRALNSWEEIGE